MIHLWCIYTIFRDSKLQTNYNIVIAWKRAASTVFRNSPLVFHKRNKVRQVLKNMRMSKDIFIPGWTYTQIIYLLASSLSHWFFPPSPLFSVWAWVCTKQCLFQYSYFMLPPCSHGSSEAQSKPYYSDYSPTRLLIHKMCTSHYLDLFITIVIGLNVITMSMEHYQQPKVVAWTCWYFIKEMNSLVM